MWCECGVGANQSLLWYLQSWLLIFKSGNPTTNWQSELVTTCFLKIPNKFTLPGILVLDAMAICPAITSRKTEAKPESANRPTSRMRFEHIVAVPLAGIKPGLSSASPTSLPWYRSTLLPRPHLKLAWFWLWTSRVRLRVTLSSNFITGKDSLGATPSREADTSWVLGCLSLKTVTLKMNPTNATSSIRKRVVARHTMVAFRLCLCLEWGGGRGGIGVAEIPFSWSFKIMMISLLFSPLNQVFLFGKVQQGEKRWRG